MRDSEAETGPRSQLTRRRDRVGPNEVSIDNAEAVLIITGGKSWQKGQSYDTTASGNSQVETSLISIRDRAFWCNVNWGRR